MHCPYCKNEDTKVLDSRVADDGGSIRRRRTCSECDRRFTTVEKMQLTVLKRSTLVYNAKKPGYALIASPKYKMNWRVWPRPGDL